MTDVENDQITVPTTNQPASKMNKAIQSSQSKTSSHKKLKTDKKKTSRNMMIDFSGATHCIKQNISNGEHADLASSDDQMKDSTSNSEPSNSEPKKSKSRTKPDENEETVKQFSDEGNYDHRDHTTSLNNDNEHKKMLRRFSFGIDGSFAICRDTTDKRDTSLCLYFELDNGDDASDHVSPKRMRSNHSSKPTNDRNDEIANSFVQMFHRSRSNLMDSMKSYVSFGTEPRGDRRPTLAMYRHSINNKHFRISKNPTEQKAERVEAFFYNHGMEIALFVLFLAINILAASHGAYQFTEAGGWTTDNDILRVTLPIARAGGRLVTVNCAILLLTACKFLWTCVRTYVVPILPIGFPIDNVMPKYHRYVALTIIVAGCFVHTLPQIVNYVTKSITIDHQGIRLWTFGNGFATKQLLITGTLLTIIFSTFFVTTLKSFRKTAAGFRWFWFFHMGGIATAYPLLLIHGTCRGHPIFFYVALLPLILYMFDIFMRRSKVSTAKILQWKPHDDEGQQITELILECPSNFSYTPGQYAELKFLPISRNEWHPFTIASAPNEEKEIDSDSDSDNDSDSDSDSDSNYDKNNDSDSSNAKKKIVFYIKNSGRWTESLYNYASAFDLSKANKATEIMIRGPHGAPAMNYFEYKHIVVVGSGVGVTPLLSIWKYLVSKGMESWKDHSSVGRRSVATEMVTSSLHDSMLSFQSSINSFQRSFECNNDPLSVPNGNAEDELEHEETRIASFCRVSEKILESLTVSMSLFIVFVFGESITIVLQMFGLGISANVLGAALSLFALIVHGMTIVVSVVSLGFFSYCRVFKCWIEVGIILVDTVALGVSVKSCIKEQSNISLNDNTPFFVFFGMVVALHAIRIFHIFYVALKPPSPSMLDIDSSSPPPVSRRQSILGDTNQQMICSVEGILINRKYSSMQFAARNLLPGLIENENGLMSELFSMTFFGTRETANHSACDDDDEKEEVRESSGKRFLDDLMGSAAEKLDARSLTCREVKKDCFRAGRPDWNTIFLRSLSRAHASNCLGESVGVFFCGSPAIAKDLQAEAAKVTAQHQFSIKHLEGRPCKCKVIVHSESF